MKGSYIILIELKKDAKIRIGKIGDIYFKKGHYLYIGSALKGLEQRITRYFRDDKKIHWHIDYLLKESEIIDIFYKENTVREECELSNKLKEKLSIIFGFGCSDCKCKSHLFYGDLTSIFNNISSLNMIKYLNSKK